MRTLASSVNSSEQDILYAFTHGIDVDRLFAPEEIKVQRAWAKQLIACKAITAKEGADLDAALIKAGELMAKNEFDWRLEDEDIHMNLERFLVEQLGGVGKKIHLGRSRNDLVATSLRLRVARSCTDAREQLSQLIGIVATKAEQSIDVLIPGMTHLQNGQPIRFGHILSSYGYRLLADRKRFHYAKECSMAALPLGSGAFAGTTLAIDREALAAELGFRAACANSYDGVGDRDFILEGLHSMAMVAIHLTKMAEDLLYWSSSNVALVKLPAKWSTGSSIMPNKRNPDVLELIRARCARILAAEQEGKAILRGFGSSYGSDLHELKKTFFRIEGEFFSCLEILGLFFAELTIDRKVAEDMCTMGHILATDLANTLVERGETFRDAYRIAAEQVALAEDKGQQVHEGELFSQIAKGYDAHHSVEARAARGGTARAAVEQSLADLRRALDGA